MPTPENVAEAKNNNNSKMQTNKKKGKENKRMIVYDYQAIPGIRAVKSTTAGVPMLVASVIL